jgi:ribosomal protein S1
MQKSAVVNQQRLRRNTWSLIPSTNSREEKSFFEGIEKNSTIDVIVTEISDKKEYAINGSVATIYREKANDILSGVKSDEFVKVIIDELTPAGYNCHIDILGCEIIAFLPQVLAGVNKIQDDEKESLVGKELEMCVESYADDKGTWIVSRRKYLNKLAPALIQQLETNVLYTGKVTGTAPFGVFVEFNDCLTGMIHRNNLNEELQNSFDNIQPNDDIEFYVKEIIKGKGGKDKIILRQILTTSLWDTIEQGQVIEGTIREHKNFGTLVKLDQETFGLIHQTVLTPEISKLKSGDKINVVVLEVERSNRKIYLRGK